MHQPIDLQKAYCLLNHGPVVLVSSALAWMHFAIRRMERRRFPQIDRETDLPEIGRAHV